MRWFRVILLAALLLSGCPSPGPTAVGPGRPERLYDTPAGVVLSVPEFARRLDLTVLRSTPYLARMERDDRKVTILASPDGQVLVEGKVVIRSADIRPTGQTLYVSEDFVDMVRQALDAAEFHAAPPAPAEPQPDPAEHSSAARRVDVVLDAGHGGTDPGAIGYRRLLEKELNLEVVLLIADRLEREGVEVLLTRDRDVFVDLDRRVALTNKSQARLFVSVHGDASRNRKARGATVFVPRREDGRSPSHRAGRSLEAALRNVVLQSRGVRQHEINLRVLEKTRVPAVLVELGFLTTPSEAAFLARADYRQRLADALARGILEYLRGE